MARGLSGSAPKYLFTLFDVGVCAGLTDSQLWEQFGSQRGEAAELAFAALIDRHGPMVLGACRGILRDEHDAMDAFQATFLVLLRKRGSLWVRDSLGPWLHRVACRAAKRVNAEACRRRAVEKDKASNSARQTTDGERGDLAAVVHDEVDRLPDRFRTPILLCDLEGRTCAEAAQLMGCPVGTVASRLSRGRDKLRARLGRRGVALGVTAAAGALFHAAAGATVPPALSSATTRMALSSASGTGAVPTGIITLAEETLKAMFLAKFKLVAAVVLAAGLIAGGALVAARQAPGPPPGGNRGERAGLLLPVTGPGVPVVTQRSGDRLASKSGGQAANVAGNIVIFGEGKLDVPDIHQIRVLDLDGGVPRTIAEFPGHAWSGRVSPDGRRIAFLLPPLVIQGNEGINLWVMDADGRNREMIIGNAGGSIGMGVACWSQDGRKVAFHRQNKGSAVETYFVDLDRRTLERLKLADNEIVTDWSPDGTEWLTNVMGPPSEAEPRDYQIYRVKRDGSGRIRVGEPDTGNASGRFSRDGERIAYLAGAPRPTETRRSQLRMIDRGGDRSKLVLEAGAGVSLSSPCWSPDGKRIAVVSMAPGDTAVLVVDSENGGGGGAPRRLTQPPRNQTKEMSGVTIDWK